MIETNDSVCVCVFCLLRCLLCDVCVCVCVFCDLLTQAFIQHYTTQILSGRYIVNDAM